MFYSLFHLSVPFLDGCRYSKITNMLSKIFRSKTLLCVSQGTCSSFPNLTSGSGHTQSGLIPKLSCWNPCSTLSAYQAWAQAVAVNPSLSVISLNDLSFDPVGVQQSPPVLVYLLDDYQQYKLFLILFSQLLLSFNTNNSTWNYG